MAAMTSQEQELAAVRLNGVLEARTGAQVVVSTEGSALIVGWVGGPDEATMRGYVDQETDSAVRNGLPVGVTVEYARLPMPDLGDLAWRMVNVMDPRNHWSASRRRREQADVLGRLETLAENGYTAVNGFVETVENQRGRR
jgi:hypothetical protein